MDLRFFILLFVISGADLYEYNFGVSVYGILFLFSVVAIFIELIMRYINYFTKRKNNND